MHAHAALNAALNLTSLVLLIAAVRRVRRGDVPGHKRLILTALAVSAAFLVSYLIRMASAGEVQRFPEVAPWRAVYLVVLLSHTVLAALVPILAVRTAWLGLRDRRPAHRRWARVTFPIWCYVSATGVLIYVMLYHLAPALTGA